jgi:hypothetical protein
MHNDKRVQFTQQLSVKGIQIADTLKIKGNIQSNKLSEQLLNDIDGPCGAGQSHTNHSAHANFSKSK